MQVTGYTGSDADLAATVTAPGWSRASASCAASYCHGAAGARRRRRARTGLDPGRRQPGLLRQLPRPAPPRPPALAAGSDARTCGACHPDTVKDDGTIDVAAGKHLNGRPDGFAGHPADWMTKGDTDFHGQAVVRDGATRLLPVPHRHPPGPGLGHHLRDLPRPARRWRLDDGPAWAATARR